MIEVENNWWVLSGLSLLLALGHLTFPLFDDRMKRHEAVFMGLIGGVAAGYVILFMLPKIAAMSSSPYPGTTDGLALYYVLLASIVIYLTMIHLERANTTLSHLAAAFDYLVHGAYSLLVGYVFVELSSSNVVTNVLIVLILGAHLLGMNHLLRGVRQSEFDRVLRWLLCILVLAGTVTGLITEVPRVALSTITAFLGGIILINVIAEELPLRHQDRLPWFAVGVGFYLVATGLIFALQPPV